MKMAVQSISFPPIIVILTNMRTRHLYFHALLIIFGIYAIGCRTATAPDDPPADEQGEDSPSDDPTVISSSRICFDWTDDQFASYVFYMPALEPGAYFEFEEMSFEDNQICTDLDLDAIEYVIFPSNGRATTKHELARDRNLKHVEQHLLHVCRDNAMETITSTYYLDRIKTALGAFHAGIDIEVDSSYQYSSNFVAPTDPTISAIMNLLVNDYSFDTMGIKDIIIPDSVLTRSLFPMLEGLYDRYGSTHLFFGLDSMFHQQYLMLHELMHLQIRDGVPCYEIAYGDQSRCIPNISGSRTDHCEYVISVKDVFMLNGISPRWAEQHTYLRVVDNEMTCYEEIDIDYACIYNYDCTPEMGEAGVIGSTDFMNPDIMRRVLMAFEDLNTRTLRVGEAASREAVQRQFDGFVLEYRTRVMKAINAKLGTSFTLSQIEASQKLYENVLDVYEKALKLENYTSKAGKKLYYKLDSQYYAKENDKFFDHLQQMKDNIIISADKVKDDKIKWSTLKTRSDTLITR